MSPNGIRVGSYRTNFRVLFRRKNMRFGVQLCALAFSAMLSITVVADEKDADIIMLEDITVTAQKRDHGSGSISRL